MKKVKQLLILFTLLLCSCNNDDDNSMPLCDQTIVIDSERYNDPSPSQYTVSDAQLNNNGCLDITISSSGCSGDSWDVELISTIVISNGFSSQSSLSLKLINTELCAAFISKSYSFDIASLLNGNTATVLNLNLEGWDEVIAVTN